MQPMKSLLQEGRTKRVRHGESQTAAFLRLRELIVLGQLAPGGRVVEADLAQRLGLSRTPIRGALQWLQREGYVIEQKDGAKARMFVAPLTMKDAEELYSIVGHVEGLAGSLLGELPAAEREKLADTLQALNSQINDIATETPVNPRRVFDLDTTFHSRFVEASAGPRLMGLHRQVKPQIERYWRLYATSILNDLHLSVSEHDEIIASIRGGHSRAIARSVSNNWVGGLTRVSKLIHLFGERGSW
jgi:DNA-binding GntR family transcriptional regulator